MRSQIRKSGESEAMRVPHVSTMILIERIAGKVAYGGLMSEQHLRFLARTSRPGSKFARCTFLESSDLYYAFYRKTCDEYIAQIEDGTLDKDPPLICDFEPPPDRDQPQPQAPPLRVPAGITRMEHVVIKLTAQFVARYGVFFWQDLVGALSLKPLFSFLKRKHPNFSFYNGLVLVYQRVLRPHVLFPADTLLENFVSYLELYKLDEKEIDFHAFLLGLDCFTHLDLDDDCAHLSATMPPPKPLSVTMTLLEMPPLTQHPAQVHQDLDDNKPPTSLRITLKQLGIIKLTALFVARYGKHFRRELMMRVVTIPQFEFMFFGHGTRLVRESMEPAELRFQVFSVLVEAYSSVLMPCEKNAKKIDESVLGVFFDRLQLEKLEEGSETAMIDLHAFVAGVDYLANMDVFEYYTIMPPPERLSVMMSRPTHLHPGVRVRPLPSHYGPPSRPLPSDYGPLSRPLPTVDAAGIPPGVTPEELRIIKLTAQFAIRFGMSFTDALLNEASEDPRFDFIKVSDSSRYDVFNGLCTVYSRVLKPSKRVKKSDDCMAMLLELFGLCLRYGYVTYTPAFTSGVDYLASVDDAVYSAILAPPERLRIRDVFSRPFSYPDGPSMPDMIEQATPKELGMIKLTAVFVARYGVRICRDLMEKVDMKHELKFMDPADGRFGLYKVVVDAYSKVLRASDHDDDTETVLERYFDCLKWEKLQEKVPVDWPAFLRSVVRMDRAAMPVAELYAFVEGVDCFAQMEDDLYSAVMGNLETRFPGLPLPEEPEPKRQKLDDTARAPQDQIFARGSSKIRVSYPLLSGRKLIEITGEPLSEMVASLKEKIAAVVEMPVKNIMLRGKAGVLKDDKSLAQNNVTPGETLVLSWFFSRWS